MIEGKEKIDRLREYIDKAITIVVAGDTGYVGRALEVLLDAKEYIKDECKIFDNIDIIGVDMGGGSDKISVNIVDRSVIKEGPITPMTSERGPTTNWQRSWDPGITVVDRYNELSNDHKLIVNMCCTSIGNTASRTIINLLSDPESSIHTTDALYCIGSLAGLDIVDELLHNIIILCHGDFKLIMAIIVDLSNDIFSREDIIGLANKDWLTKNPIWIKYMKSGSSYRWRI